MRGMDNQLSAINSVAVDDYSVNRNVQNTSFLIPDRNNRIRTENGHGKNTDYNLSKNVQMGSYATTALIEPIKTDNGRENTRLSTLSLVGVDDYTVSRNVQMGSYVTTELIEPIKTDNGRENNRLSTLSLVGVDNYTVSRNVQIGSSLTTDRNNRIKTENEHGKARLSADYNVSNNVQMGSYLTTDANARTKPVDKRGKDRLSTLKSVGIDDYSVSRNVQIGSALNKDRNNQFKPENNEQVSDPAHNGTRIETVWKRPPSSMISLVTPSAKSFTEDDMIELEGGGAYKPSYIDSEFSVLWKQQQPTESERELTAVFKEDKYATNFDAPELLSEDYTGQFSTKERNKEKKLVRECEPFEEGQTFPPYFLYIAWLLIFCTVLATIIFAFANTEPISNEFSANWFGSVVVGFVFSALLLEPSKLLLVALYETWTYPKVDLKEWIIPETLCGGKLDNEIS